MAGFYSKLEVIFFLNRHSDWPIERASWQSILLSNIKRVMCLLAVVFSDKRVVSRAFLLPTCLMQSGLCPFRCFYSQFLSSFLFILRILILKANRAYVTRTRRPCAQEKNFQPVMDSRLTGAAPPTNTYCDDSGSAISSARSMCLRSPILRARTNIKRRRRNEQ